MGEKYTSKMGSVWPISKVYLAFIWKYSFVSTNSMSNKIDISEDSILISKELLFVLNLEEFVNKLNNAF